MFGHLFLAAVCVWSIQTQTIFFSHMEWNWAASYGNVSKKDNTSLYYFCDKCKHEVVIFYNCTKGGMDTAENVCCLQCWKKHSPEACGRTAETCAFARHVNWNSARTLAQKLTQAQFEKYPTNPIPSANRWKITATVDKIQKSSLAPGKRKRCQPHTKNRQTQMLLQELHVTISNYFLRNENSK